MNERLTPEAEKDLNDAMSPHRDWAEGVLSWERLYNSYTRGMLVSECLLLRQAQRMYDYVVRMPEKKGE